MFSFIISDFFPFSSSEYSKYTLRLYSFHVFVYDFWIFSNTVLINTLRIWLFFGSSTNSTCVIHSLPSPHVIFMMSFLSCSSSFFYLLLFEYSLDFIQFSLLFHYLLPCPLHFSPFYNVILLRFFCAVCYIVEDIQNSWLYCFTNPLELGIRVSLSHRLSMRKQNLCPTFKRISETI